MGKLLKIGVALVLIAAIGWWLHARGGPVAQSVVEAPVANPQAKGAQ